MYPDDLFYKVHKISKGDLIQKLDSAKSQEERDKILMSLYDDEAQRGR
jgi:hypothetical protein